MEVWGDLGHSETGSGETVDRVLTKKKEGSPNHRVRYGSVSQRCYDMLLDMTAGCLIQSYTVGRGQLGDPRNPTNLQIRLCH